MYQLYMVDAGEGKPGRIQKTNDKVSEWDFKNDVEQECERGEGDMICSASNDRTEQKGIKMTRLERAELNSVTVTRRT